MKPFRWLPAALLAATISACYATRRSQGLGVSPVALHPGAAAERPAGRVLRNVEASDYAGSHACAACHGDLVRRFTASPMHRMTRAVTDGGIAAPFKGETLFVGKDRAILETRDGAPFVRIEGEGKTLLYRVTRVLGGHHREDFVGVLAALRVAEHETKASPGGDELVLPVSYLIDRKRLRYKGYSVMVKERDRLVAGPSWSQTCIFCHNTVPLLSTLFGALAGPKAPHYQGEVVDRLLPRDRAFRYGALDESGLDGALRREMLRLGVDTREAPATLEGAIQATRHHFVGKDLLEVGIGCESCHGGCREHVTEPSILPSLLPRAPYLAVDGPDARSPAAVETHACARCHQVLFSRYPWTWEGGTRDGTRGGSHISSGEARDLMLGGCQGALRCSACHDPHASDDTEELADLEGHRGNEVCLGCHGALRSQAAWKAHAHHEPDGKGGACIGCHMPRKNMSLDGRLGRYHRIGSPTEPARVLEDRPLECALCHADKSVGELVGTMEAWWHVSYDRDALRRSYGDLAANPLRATLQRGKPHEKAVALSVLGRAHDRASGSLFAAELDDEYPLVRDYAVDALRETFGDACDLHLERDQASRDRDRARCGEAAGFRPVGAARHPPSAR